MEIRKTTKIKNAEKKKRTVWQEQLAQVCSQIVSVFAFCVSFNFAFFAENTIKIGVSAKKKEKKKKQNSKVKNWSKLKLKTGPSMLRNIIGPIFNFRNCICFCCLLLLVFQKTSSFCRENEIFKNKKKNKQKNKKNGPVFNFKKGKNWTSF